jgi:hypothetical protein
VWRWTCSRRVCPSRRLADEANSNAFSFAAQGRLGWRFRLASTSCDALNYRITTDAGRQFGHRARATFALA